MIRNNSIPAIEYLALASTVSTALRSRDVIKIDAAKR